MNDLRDLERSINYTFNNKELLLEALTHKSYSYENNLEINYERLEFLGDSIINYLLTDILFKKYAHIDEGILSILRGFLASKDFLYSIAKDLCISDFVRIGKNEKESAYNENPSLLCDVLEAIIGAIYLDSSLENVRLIFSWKFLENLDYFLTNIEQIDSKSLLQKYVSKIYKKMPQYTLVEEMGPDHNKTFIVEVSLPNNVSAKGVAKKKKLAEKIAAKAAVTKLNINGF